MYNKTQLLTAIKADLNINCEDWERMSRTMHIYNPSTGIATYSNTSDSEKLNGLIMSSAYSYTKLNSNTVEIKTKLVYRDPSTKVRKQYDVINTIIKSDDKITLFTYLEYFDALITFNKDKNKQTIERARTLFNLASADEAQVIREMATSISEFRHDPVEFTDATLFVDIIHEVMPNNRVKLSAKLIKNGTEIHANRCHFEVWPDNNFYKASAQFPSRQEFYITTDLRDREAYPIMSAGKIKVRAFCWTEETDGDSILVSKEEIIDLTGILPTYNYFNL